VYPHRSTGDFSNPVFKELRVAADLGYKTSIKLTDFTDQDEIDVTLRHSNVVICSIGSRKFYNTDKDFEEANIHVPATIARSVRDNKQIKRFIYISAAGADPNSPSRMLRTKWIGEQKVREICPDVTVLRPTTIFQSLDNNNSPQAKWGYMLKMFNRTFFRIEGANGLVQPVNASDVALACVNCLRMDETIGQVYELGGPHVYTWDDIYEEFYNVTGVKPYIIPIKMETALEWAHSPKLSSVYRYLGKYWMYPEFIFSES
jgi:NADH dehydrogenase (ubiquinone) 1 alpha subcomplex subunit 9